MDARIVAATNQDLGKAIQVGQFREDLYYRLSVFVITMPSLRQREGDISLLAKALLERYSFEYKKKITGFTSQAIHALEAHNWAGNIRELENVLQRYNTLGRIDFMDISDTQTAEVTDILSDFNRYIYILVILISVFMWVLVVDL